MRIAIITVFVIVLAGCGTMGQDLVRTANIAKTVNNITEAGVREEVENCAKDWFDPVNRGSRCTR